MGVLIVIEDKPHVLLLMTGKRQGAQRMYANIFGLKKLFDIRFEIGERQDAANLQFCYAKGSGNLGNGLALCSQLCKCVILLELIGGQASYIF